MKKNSRLILITILFASLFLTSCHEDFLVISSKFDACKINSDSSRIVFFHILKASEPPKGISRFPDGGTHNTIYKNICVYTYTINEQKLKKVFDFGNLPYGSWNFNTTIQNKSFVFSISPTTGWDWSINNTTISESYKNLAEKYMGLYKYDFLNKELTQHKYNVYDPELSPDENQIIYLKRDSLNVGIGYYNINEQKNRIIKTLESNSAFIPLYWIDNNNIAYKADDTLELFNLQTNGVSSIDKEIIPKPSKIPIRKVKELTKQFSFQDWGFKLTDYCQRNEKEYINDIVVLNGNLNYRKAILQILSPNFNKEDYKNILIKMKKYENLLEGLEKTEYEIYSTETKELIEHYLNQ